MKTIRLPKADSIGNSHPTKVMIIIADKLPDIQTLDESKDYYDGQAKRLVAGLINALPQGIIEPLIIHLLKKRVSLYVGTMKKHTKTED